jgi:hypothetical protein
MTWGAIAIGARAALQDNLRTRGARPRSPASKLDPEATRILNQTKTGWSERVSSEGSS